MKPIFKTLSLTSITLVTFTPVIITSCATNQTNFNPINNQTTISDAKILNEQIFPQLIVAKINSTSDLKQLGITLALKANYDQALRAIKQKWTSLTNQNQSDLNPNLDLEWTINNPKDNPWQIRILATQIYDLELLAHTQQINLALKIEFKYQNQLISTKLISDSTFKDHKYPISYQFNPNYANYLNRIPITNDDLIYHRLVNASHQFNPEVLTNFIPIAIAIDQQQMVSLITTQFNEHQLVAKINNWDQAIQQWLIAKINYQADDHKTNQLLIQTLKQALINQLEVFKAYQISYQIQPIKLNQTITKINLDVLNRHWSQFNLTVFNQGNYQTKLQILGLDQDNLNPEQLIVKLALLIKDDWFQANPITKTLAFDYPLSTINVLTNNIDVLNNLISYVHHWNGQINQIEQLIRHFQQNINWEFPTQMLHLQTKLTISR